MFELSTNPHGTVTKQMSQSEKKQSDKEGIAYGYMILGKSKPKHMKC